MPHPSIDNDTPLVIEPLFALDEGGRPALTVVVKASFVLEGRVLALMDEQPPLDFVGQLWCPDAEVSSYRREPEVAPIKPSTDVAIIGHAHAPEFGTQALEVGVWVGPVEQRAWVFGERMWLHPRVGEPELGPPARFDRMPLCYERAFGGAAAPGEPGHQSLDPRNPVGRGHRDEGVRPRDGELAPNIERPSAPIRSWRDRPAPVGFGFCSPNWWPRAALAGSYDQAWMQARKPLLPRDFDPRFYNAASPELIAPEYLRGDEPVRAINIGPERRLDFRLPGLPPPSIRVALPETALQPLAPKLDTVILDFDLRTVTLLWRDRVSLPRGPQDLQALELRCPALDRIPRQTIEPKPTIEPAANVGPGASHP